jgi:hypothetical protein
MKSRLLPGVCLILLLAGCGKKQEVANPTAAPGGDSATATAPAAGQTGAAGAPTTDSAAVLTPLTQALRKYYFEHRQVPPTFEEFATAAGIQVPPAPAGKKFAINRKSLEIVLVDNR